MLALCLFPASTFLTGTGLANEWGNWLVKLLDLERVSGWRSGLEGGGDRGRGGILLVSE